PGKFSTMSDGWTTADNTERSFLGMMAHWIEVKDTKWKLHSEVVGFQLISGEHSGGNLGQYFVGLLYIFLISNICLPWLRCLEHVVNLANVAVMGHITKITVIENTNTIWEYDPKLPNNCILGGSLDVVVAFQTLAFKIQASRQCIEYFEKLQVKCKVTTPLKIPLHSN
ncbi:hypothetical protein L208DRAFT_1068778, partial [Tricholoma matsutake]